MSKLTRRGIAYDLKISPYRTVKEYGEDDILTYVFSSQQYKDIFERKLQENRNKISDSLTKRFNFNIKQDKLADIRLYILTEKRGFLIIEKEEIDCLDSIKLDGVSLILKN